MGERKVLNKYIPPDFDPSLVPRGKKLSAKDGTVPVRMMLPFSIQCGTCNTFLYRGTKFNSKKEAMGGPDGTYLGITRWRFYIKCTSCARSLTFLTDPKNADYEMESGGTRNYEVYKDQAQTEEAAAAQVEEEEKLDPMKALENRVLDSQREMKDLENLEHIKAMNARHVQLLTHGLPPPKDDHKEGVEMNNSSRELSQEDEELVKSIQFGKRGIVRLDEKDEERLEQERKRKAELLEQQLAQLVNRASQKTTTTLPVIKVKRKRIQETEPKTSVPATKTDTNSSGGLSSLLRGYGSDSD